MHIADAIAQQPFVPYVRLANYAKRKKPFQPKERRLLDYQLIYFQEGHGVMEVDGHCHEVRENQFVLIQPNQLHNFVAATDLIFPLLHFDLFYNPQREKGFFVPHGIVDLSPYSELIQTQLNDLDGVHIPVIVEPPHPSAFKEMMLKAIALWQNNDVLSRIEADQLIAQLALVLLRQYSALPQAGQMYATSLHWVPAYMMLHIAEPIQVGDMARRAGLSASRFTALFAREFHMGPHQYLLHRRIENAQQLLRNPALTLADIAESCGFSDMHHLSKMFKKITGSTPREFRKTLL